MHAKLMRSPRNGAGKHKGRHSAACILSPQKRAVSCQRGGAVLRGGAHHHAILPPRKRQSDLPRRRGWHAAKHSKIKLFHCSRTVRAVKAIRRLLIFCNRQNAAGVAVKTAAASKHKGNTLFFIISGDGIGGGILPVSVGRVARHKGRLIQHQ